MQLDTECTRTKQSPQEKTINDAIGEKELNIKIYS